MYQKKSERLQMTIEDFMMPFGGHLSAEKGKSFVKTLEKAAGGYPPGGSTAERTFGESNKIHC